tara:strand:+ start:140 stop:376 length:237 start_codon:yes stop_codon:yes gene_type:complete
MSKYTQEKYKEFAMRAKDFIAKNPDASRKRISDYAGVHSGALDRLSKDYGFAMPKAMTPQQTRRASNWGTILGGLSKK